MVDTVRTESDLLQIFKDLQAVGAISANDVRDFIVSAKYLSTVGWEFHLDGTYTPIAPRTILAGVRTKVTIDGALGDFGHPAVDHSDGHFWDTVNNRVNATGLNNFAIGRFSVVAHSVTAPDNHFELEIDVGGGSFPIIFQETAALIKGAGVDHNYNFIIPLFVGPDFLANGAEAYITPDADMEFHTHALTIVRVYSATTAT